MGKGRWNRLRAPILLVFLTILINGCAKEPALRQEVTTEYLLTTSGFQKWDVNMQTPKWQALRNNLPKGKISTYKRNGDVYHVYVDVSSDTLYVGDEVAYQKYLAKAYGRQMCQRVTGPNQVEFWECMDDYQQGGARRR